MKDPRHPGTDEIVLTRVLAALSDPVRLGVVRLLAGGGERGWGELRAPVAKSTLSHHMKVLRDAGITRTRQEGTRCYVRLRRADLDARFPDLLPAVLAAAGTDDVGAEVTAAP
ncbi:ArsR/SmtB family transcription factor [Streptomyces sp. WMMC897]|uniref:ArsR/SmtB family transcription factor n=1 Tax=Streptomyces sp. WMMC897 TaxID=3014782 RepID=UPI0022B5ECA3|nr:metalloregulator ArsR/SmtB family transcription factor [Streptomyces sp. WMMC897]MCZ7417252.1 metalloregulator ArsR/SmtB family transcription factor [Streptomyces sp. WMMC897]